MLERILTFSICHRYLVVLFTLAAAGIGIYSFQKLPIDAVPDITNRQVQINTEYPAFSPEEIEKQITFPVETALSGIPGLEYTRSISRNGFSQITAVFHEDTDIFFARQQVGERLAESRGNLPPGAEPALGPIATGLGEIYMWTVEYRHPDGKGAERKDGEPGWQNDGTYLTPEGERLTNEIEMAAYLRTVQDWIIRPRVKEVPGVAGVDAIGGYVKQYCIQPDPKKMQSYGVTFHDIVESVERNNMSVGAGYIEHMNESYTVRAYGRIADIGQIKTVPVLVREGTPIHIGDMADVSVCRELRTGSASEDGEEIVAGTALMLIGENSRTVASAVDEKINEINKNLPPDIRAKTVLDRSRLVNATIETVRKNLFEGAVLVVVVLFLLLGNFRAAILTALVIPLSMLIAFTGMVQSKISGNLMSLGAIDFGIIVDGSVIIVENFIRMIAEKQRETGRKLTLPERLRALSAAARQVQTATLFGIAIIIVVYVPILTLTGVEGKMFRPMAATVMLALAASFVISQTFIPALAAIFLTGRVKERESLVMRAAHRLYEPVVGVAMKFRYPVVGAAVVVFAGALFLFTRLGQEFAPTLDEGDLLVNAIRIPSVSLSESTEMQKKIEKAIRELPEVKYVFSKTGTAEMASDPMPVNISDTFIILKPRAEWPNPRETKLDFIERVEELLGGFPGQGYEFTQPIQMRFNELISGVRSDVAIKVFGDDFESMEKTSAKIAGLLSSIPGAADVKVEQTGGFPVMNVHVDRDAASRMGTNVSDVLDLVSIAIGGKEAGVVFEGDRRFNIVVRLHESMRRDPKQLELIPVPVLGGPRNSMDGGGDTGAPTSESGNGGYIPLSQVADVETGNGLNQISRENGKRRIVVQANVRGRDVGSFVAEARRRIAEEISIPPGSWIAWGGQFENLAAARARLLVVAPACVFLIFILLFTALGSAKQAILVFTGVPFALTGGIISLWLGGMPFSISAAVGFIALSGVAVLNGLVMVSFINDLIQRGTPMKKAVIKGAVTRLRPVLMTALVASLGFVPMAVATGTGAEVQKPLATVVIGGLISSTILTLLVLPAMYSWFSGRNKCEPDLQPGELRSGSEDE